MLAKKYISTEDSIFFYPKRFEEGENFETWLFPHCDTVGNEYNNLVHAIFKENDVIVIVIFSEDKNTKKDEVQLTKIINLFHDICTDFEIIHVLVDDVYDVDIDSEIAKLQLI